MKNVLLLAGLCALPVLTQAQTEKGQGIWTGNLSFSYGSAKQNQNKFNSFYRTSGGGLSFNRGVFLKDNWLAGGVIDLSLSNTHSRYFNSSYPDGVKQTILTTGIGGFVRRYWGKEAWRIFLGGELSFEYALTQYKGTNVSDADVNSFTIKPVAQVGGNYFINSRIGLEASAFSTSFPALFNGFTIGLVILTGGSKESATKETQDFAQTVKGRMVLGGSLRYTTEGNQPKQPGIDATRSNDFFLSPSVGWFVKKNLLLGVEVPLSAQLEKGLSTFSYGIATYLKKYVSDNQLRPYVGGYISYTASRTKLEGTINPDLNVSNIGFAINAGLAYMLGDRFIIEGGLGYISFYKPFYPKSTGSHAWSGGLSATLQPGFTINYVFD